MKKINNKGMTLVELIISVALISIIMLFMYKLILDVRKEKKEINSLTDNILKISDIEVKVFNKYMEHVNYDNVFEKAIVSNNSNSFTIILKEKDVSSQHIYNINIQDNKLSLSENSTLIEKWALTSDVKSITANKSCEYSNSHLNCLLEFVLNDEANKKIDTINFPLYVKTESYKE